MNIMRLAGLLRRHWWIIGFLLVVVVILFSPLASSHPDGLERVAEDQGFSDQAEEAPYRVMPDYLFPGIENEALSTILAGLVGAAVLLGLGFGLAWVLRRRSA